jgi:predicted PurR-regulated permease PerM
VFLVVLYMIFIFAEQAVFRRKILAVASARADDAEQVLDSISLGIQRYLGVKTITSLATAVLCYSVLLTLDLPYALLFGFLTFLLNYIPTFGSFAAAILPISTAIADRVGLTEPLIVAGTYLTVNVLLGSFLEPRLLGRELNLSPLVILVSVVVWAALWGVPGAFLAVPLTATAQIVLSNFESTRNIAVLLSNGPPREPRGPSSS